MKRSYSWLSALCRFAGLIMDEEPVLPVHTPVSTNSGARSPAGFPLDSYGLSEVDAYPADKWSIQIERGQGSSSVCVPMTLRQRQQAGMPYSA